MRRVHYSVAMSLDGYIAGPKGESDWIVIDPDIDFNALFTAFDTVLLGRKTYEATRQPGNEGGMSGIGTYVFSRTLRPADGPGVFLSDNPKATLTALRAKVGKDIWLFGGGSLFRSLLQLGLVDSVEVAIIPVLLGGGVPFLPEPAKPAHLLHPAGPCEPLQSPSQAALRSQELKWKRCSTKPRFALLNVLLKGRLNRPTRLPGCKHIRKMPCSSPRSLRTEGSGNLAYVYGQASWVSGRSSDAAPVTNVRLIIVWRKEEDGQWRVAQEFLNAEPAAM